MRIIFVNRYFYPDQSATSRMLSSLAFALAGQGISVTVVTSRQYHDRHEQIAEPSEIRDGVDIHRVAASGFGRGKLVGRAVDYATFHFSVAWWLAANARAGDICVICTDPPLMSVTAAAPLALRGAKMANWIMDLFPEAAIELDLLQRNSIAARLATALRDWSYRRSVVNVCPMESMARYLAARHVRHERLSVLHHWSDGSEIFPVDRKRNSLRREWGMDGKFVVGYSGNFGRAHEFDTLLRAAERLMGEDDIRFLLIGDGQKRGYVEGEIARRRLTNVLLKPLQPRDRLAESLGAADLHFVSLLPRLEHCIVPSKFYGILAAGRPTLFAGDPKGEIARAVASAGCGISVDIGRFAQAAAYIKSLRDAPELHEATCIAARHLFDACYTRDRGVAAWRDVVERIDGELSPTAAGLQPESAIQ